LRFLPQARSLLDIRRRGHVDGIDRPRIVSEASR
jgi:hypothetical protein